LTHLYSPSGGLAAILAGERTRESVRAALRARRVYATNGPRIILRAALGGKRMGSAVPAPQDGEKLWLYIRVIAPEPLAALDVVQSGVLTHEELRDGTRELTTAIEIDHLRPGDWLYVRVIQIDGGAAWSSPFFID
jgi:hypothetical protein